MRNPARPIDNSGCLIPFGALFAIIGIATGASALFQGPVGGRDAGLRLLMSVIFAGNGTVLALWGVSTRRMAQRSKALASQNPDQPWLWREDWARGSADAESKSQFLTYCLMGILFVLISSPALLNLKHELAQRHNYAILVALIFPLAGVFLISQALQGRIRAGKFGAIFRMAQVPGVAGWTSPRAEPSQFWLGRVSEL